MLPTIAGQRPRLRPPASAIAAAQDARECGPLVLAPNQLHEGHVRIRRQVINQVTLCIITYRIDYRVGGNKART